MSAMSRLTKLTKDEVAPDVKELYGRVGAQRGNVPNMFRVDAHYFNRVNDALLMEPTKPGEGL